MVGRKVKSIIAYHNFYTDFGESVSLWPDTDAVVSDKIEIMFSESERVLEHEFSWGKAYCFNDSGFYAFNEIFHAKSGEVYVLYFDGFSSLVKKVFCDYRIV